ncbi:MAG TPA: photosynthetic reaction center cytochrome c subunit family protein [Gemmatimonadaceae bacterium]|nr:photosynthetic reaction center cytochrome c subunit family protein [Gemmatimonadaceae bacterium]
MRSSFRFTALPLLLIAAASCSQSKPAAAPAPGSGPAARPAAAPPAAAPANNPAAGTTTAGRGGAPGAGGAPGGGRGGPPMTPEQRAARRDSIGTLRSMTNAQLMKEIAGHENDPAGTVFKNVQLNANKTMPAGRFLVMMDSTYGRGLGRNCTDCHVANQWASDSLGRKKTARIMAELVESVNTTQLTKLPVRAGAQPARITCITCHRGNPGGPGQALMP